MMAEKFKMEEKAGQEYSKTSRKNEAAPVSPILKTT
jgi:hypothetical protein